jgi:hypothetical protein
MAHECPECGCRCFCHGDIDDLTLGIRNDCQCCWDDDDDEEDYDDGDWGDWGHD